MFDEDKNEDYYDPKLINTAFKIITFIMRVVQIEKNMLSPDEYFKMIDPHLIELINKHKEDDSWKIQLNMKINFTPIQDFNDKNHFMLR